MNRFFIPQHWIKGNVVRLEGRYAHQMGHVLRLGPGDSMIVLDNTGHEYDVEMTAIENDYVIGQIKNQRVCKTEPRSQVTLFQSLLKRDKFEWVLQKCTEVGVAEIVPVITRRSLIRTTHLKPEKQERWQTIIREAAEQCTRGRMPVLAAPINFSTSLERVNHYHLGLIAAPKVDCSSLATVVKTVLDANPPRVGLWIGPEGGFDPSEIEEAVGAGAVCVGLGKRILRTETAAVVTCALTLHELGEL